MKRIHALEWEDLPWFPKAWRDYGTDYLGFIATKFNVYSSVLPFILKGIDSSGRLHWVDLASGGGGGLLNLAKAIKTLRPGLKITLTDLYPNLQAFQNLQNAGPDLFEYEQTSVNAMQPPEKFRSDFKTIFGAFHHLRPDEARAVLQNAVDTGSPIAVFEPLGRHPGAWISMLFVPLNVLILTFFIRPVRWQILPFIYIFHLIPLYVLWDGIASILRMYSEKELRAMVAMLNHTDTYEWEIGKTGGPMPVYYLTGQKKTG